MLIKNLYNQNNVKQITTIKEPNLSSHQRKTKKYGFNPNKDNKNGEKQRVKKKLGQDPTYLTTME